MRNFRTLRIWQNAMKMTKKSYRLSKLLQKAELFGLQSQIQRSSTSIASNIAEGDELGTIKNGIKHFWIAKGSIAEVVTQLILAQNFGYVSDSDARPLIDKANKIGAMLTKLIKVRGGFTSK